MKKTFLFLTAVLLVGATPRTAQAGDREWATAGKILTGVFAGSVLTRALDPAPVYTHSHTTIYTSPGMVSPPVYIQNPQVIVHQQPVIIRTTPVVVQPAPVYVAPAPVYYYHPQPVVTYHYSHHRHHSRFFGRSRAPFCW